MTNTELKIPETNENFEALLNEQFGDKGITGSVVKGTIIRLTPDFAIVDVGLKSEGRIPLREFGQNAELKVGDKVEVYVDRYEDKDGQIVLSREKHAAKKFGRIWKNALTPAKESTALSSAASKAALPLISTAPLLSCPALRLIFVRSATLRR